MKINLQPHDFIASGGTRDVYHYPLKSDRCIKIQQKKGDFNRNEKEFYLGAAKNSIIPLFFGEVNTNYGRGIVVEIIRDFDHSISLSLLDYIKKGGITKKHARAIIEKIGLILIKNKLLLHDAGLQNILLKKDKNGNFSPVVIDGLGEKHRTFNYLLRLWFPALRLIKTRKKLSRLLEKLENEYLHNL